MLEGIPPVVLWTALAGLLVISTGLGFVAGIVCAPSLQDWALRRAGQRMQRFYELALGELDRAARCCQRLAESTGQTMSPSQWRHFEGLRTQFEESFRKIGNRQRPPSSHAPAPAEVAARSPSPFVMKWSALTIDTTTSLPDERAFETHFAELLAASKTHYQTSGLLLVRMDKAENFQERFGEPSLRTLEVEMASLIRQTARPEDLVCRIAADSFAVLMPSVSPLAGARLAETHRAAMRQHPFRLDKTGSELLVTASFGFVPCLPDEPAGLPLDRAREALAKSQVMGRNQLHVHDTHHRTLTRVQ